jgi:hypothetical protein
MMHRLCPCGTSFALEKIICQPCSLTACFVWFIKAYRVVPLVGQRSEREVSTKNYQEEKTMKKEMVKKIVSVLVIALFMVSFAGVAVSNDDKGTVTIKGTVVSIDGGSGEIVVKDESGKMITLTSGPTVDITKLGAGDTATFVHDSRMVIKSVTE